MGVLSFYGDNYTLFCHNYITEFVKNANSIYVIVVTPFSRKVSLATTGVCVFSAVYFGSRTFLSLGIHIDAGEKMNNYCKITNQDVQGINGEDFFECMSNENRELFKRALSEATDLKTHKIDEEIKNVELPPLSKRHKIRMNRLFRERIGGSFIPFPEKDNL